MKASVVLCSHNPRTEYLQRTLDALRGQTLSTAEWELLLIDNASEQPLARRFDLAWHCNARHLKEEQLGKMFAWRLGIRNAVAETLIFVDDDNVLSDDYLEQAIGIADEKVFIGVWGGNVIPEFESPPPSWCREQMWRLAVTEVGEDIWSNLRDGFTTMPVGAGMCIRRAVGLNYLEWCRQNPQSFALDRSGHALGGYGEMNLAHSAIDLGLGTGRFACLRLTHLIPSSRLTLSYFVRHAEQDAASLMVFRALRRLPIPDSGRRSFSRTIRWYLHCLRNRIPRQIIMIYNAHHRGLETGIKIAQKSTAASTSGGASRRA